MYDLQYLVSVFYKLMYDLQYLVSLFYKLTDVYAKYIHLKIISNNK
jgi:hypothetical protein